MNPNYRGRHHRWIFSTYCALTIAILALPLACHADESAWRLSLTPAEEVQKALSSPVNLEFEDIYVGEILDFIHKAFELNLALDQRVVSPKASGSDAQKIAQRRADAVVTDGMVPRFQIKDTPLNSTLRALGIPLNLVSIACGHQVWMTSAAQIAADNDVPMPWGTIDATAMMERPVNVTFSESHLQRYVDYLNNVLELNIIVDQRVVMPLGGDGQKPPEGAPGYVTDGILQPLDLKDCPLGEALYTLTRLLNLSYVVTEEGVFISTPELLQEKHG